MMELLWENIEWGLAVDCFCNGALNIDVWHGHKYTSEYLI